MKIIGATTILKREAEFLGMTFEEVEIPADIIDEAREYRGLLLEAVAEFDESLMEKYFVDEIIIDNMGFVVAINNG